MSSDRKPINAIKTPRNTSKHATVDWRIASLRNRCQMNLNDTRTLLALLTLLTLGDRRHPRTLVPTAQACGPRVFMQMDRPFRWALFGQGANDDDNNAPADKEAERRSHWTTSDWIEKHKYALELHSVHTADGFQLSLHRLPRPGRRPILLVHGLAMSSLSWVLMGPGRSLAFLLYDKRYDVWLANLRGSAYGRTHTYFNASDANFWSYSFHEAGVYDLPAIIDHIRNASSFHQVSLVGHSQAFNAFLAMCTVHPEYNERVQMMQALAPVVALHNNVQFGTDDVQRAMRFAKSKAKRQSFELFPVDYLRGKCLRRNSDERRECLKLMQTFAGSGQYEKSVEPILYGQLLRGGSLKEIKHLQQLWDSGDFVAFDYGVAGNRQHYNSVEPHNYALRLVTVPLILHFGPSDAIATPAGVHRIYARLLNSVMGVHRVAANKFNHFDFLCANDVKTLLNDKLIDLMEKYFAGKLPYVIE